MTTKNSRRQRSQRTGAPRRPDRPHRRPRGRQVHLAGEHRVAERHPQPVDGEQLLRPGRRAGPPDSLHLRRRPSRGVRLRGQRPHAGGVRAGGPGQLPDRRHRRRRPEPSDIQLRSVKATIEGDHDILGILGGDPEVRNGFTEIRVHYDIDADATPEEIRGALVAQSQKRSAVFDAADQPDQRHRRGQLIIGSGSAHDDGRHRGRTHAAWRSAISSPGARSTTWSSSAGRWPTRGGPSAGIRCGC